MAKRNSVALPAKKVVLVIGNGFDLDLRLRTSYSDFVDSSFFKYLNDASIPCPVEILEGVDLNKMKMHPNVLASYIQDKKEHNNWVDLEECIREFCEQQLEEFVDKDALRKELFAIRYMLFHYLAKVVDYQFGEWNMFFKNHIAYKLLDGIVKSAVDYQIWDFNYTFTCERLLELMQVPLQEINRSLHYIHGQLYKENENERWPIVLGTNSTPKVQKICPSAVKSNASGYYDNCRAFKADLSNASAVVFMGHSMGSTDRPYFANMLKSSKLEQVAIITKSESSLDEFRANMEIATGELYGTRKEETKIRELVFTSDGYYELFQRFNAEKTKQFERMMHEIVA